MHRRDNKISHNGEQKLTIELFEDNVPLVLASKLQIAFDNSSCVMLHNQLVQTEHRRKPELRFYGLP